MLRDISVAVLVLFGAACGSQPEADKATVGQDVAVTKADGGVVQGKVTANDEKTVTMKTGKTTKTIPKDQIANVKTIDKPKPADTPDKPGAPVASIAPVKPADLPPIAKWREYTVPEGTKLSLKLATAVSSATSKVEDAVEATLAEAVSIEGADVLPAGSVVKGLVSAAEGSGRVKGLASLTLKFQSLTAAGRDDKYEIDATYSETAQPTKASDAKKIGGGAAAGAVIGGLLGGKGGAAKGAAIGGGAGVGVTLATKGKEVEYAAGATLTVELKKAVEVKIAIK
jgi:hypothetical protein